MWRTDMNNWIKSYLHTVRRLFPMMGRSEKTYLKNLSSSIEDFFEDHPPDSMEEVIEKFGLPEDVVSNYLGSSDPEYLLKRIKIAKRWRVLTICLLVTFLIGFVFFACWLWFEYDSYLRFIDGAMGYCIEYIE